MDAAFFDRWSLEYDDDVIACDEANLYPFAGYRRTLESLLDAIKAKPGAKVLDLGFGTAKLTQKLYDAGYEISGLDFSPEMCRIAQEKMPKAQLICFDFAQGLPTAFKDARFDIIVSSYAFHHVPDSLKPARIVEWYDALNPGGMILIGDVAFLNEQSLELSRSDAGDEWDEDEDYMVFSFLQPEIAHLSPKYEQISYCAGILTIYKTYC
ncbi:MAG TPA: class I SAM-dependent methyltransferase [Anaerolineaceae bacterium]|nr:class I SAM-dependent methyltransferase [Anaerolineaceae bacterium]